MNGINNLLLPTILHSVPHVTQAVAFNENVQINMPDQKHASRMTADATPVIQTVRTKSDELVTEYNKTWLK